MPVQPTRSGDGRHAESGSAAVDGLAKLITEAVLSSDDKRVDEFDRILRHVEAMIDLNRLEANESQFQSLSVHERQASYCANHFLSKDRSRRTELLPSRVPHTERCEIS